MKKKLISFLVAVMMFNVAAAPLASANDTSEEHLDSDVDQDVLEEFELESEADFEVMSDILLAIEELPYEIIDEGPDAVVEWLSNYSEEYFVTIDDEGLLQFHEAGFQAQFSVPGCIGAVGAALLLNGIPFAKITKVKKALDALGGTAKAVKEIKKWYDKYRYGGFSRTKALNKAVNKVSSSLSSSLKTALLDFFNINIIIANCT
ncbi:hypothetical protein P4475_18565 [Halalkalibacterium halodurans]|uniref:hypothetical protein n=1 Tax=Halalkalibacterium halodurans TaxID=86665 RepID=UPI0006A96788|nr:hypothetical protein [Halalkalibacterium halodurans]MDY7224480.1 hypothetical protein [Halalkalibacterium halodurans]MDY7243765.1 hypothetical protein [Halalkalibacterium halodurans]MED3648774.1 hypothetical protein [Halalkalibacterium halodurans]TPE69203.1 hypothetical protein AMD02_009215 [Halalkalibacterium halodurans]